MNKTIQSQSEYSRTTSFSASKLEEPTFIAPTVERILTNPVSQGGVRFFVVTPLFNVPRQSKDVDDFVDELLQLDPTLSDELARGREWVASEVFTDCPMTLRTLRLRAGLSQRELADKVGLQQPNISEMERGRRKPTLDTARRLAKALEIRVEEVLCTF